MMEKLLYRPEEVAEICSVGRTTIYEAMRQGQLESVKIGASRRVPADAIVKFVESLRPASREAPESVTSPAQEVDDEREMDNLGTALVEALQDAGLWSPGLTTGAG